MDDERLKNGGSVLTEKYFEQLLEQIREIRLSERRFYQKITDIMQDSGKITAEIAKLKAETEFEKAEFLYMS